MTKSKNEKAREAPIDDSADIEFRLGEPSYGPGLLSEFQSNIPGIRRIPILRIMTGVEETTQSHESPRQETTLRRVGHLSLVENLEGPSLAA